MESGHQGEPGQAKGAQTPPNAHTAPDPTAVREQCERILADPLFRNSRRSSDLLRYIVEKTLNGEHECLKERIIGIEVLGRSPDYDVNQAATVRSAITVVRKRLDSYFEDPAHHRELRIDIPAGSYVAEFSLPKNRSQEPVETVAPEQDRSEKRKRPHLRYIYMGASIIVVLLAASWGFQQLKPSAAIDRFWAPVVNSQGTVLISIGNPVSGTPSGPEGTPGATGGDLSLGQFIAQQSDYPVAELRAANAIESFLAQHRRQSVIRLAQTTVLSDLRGTPAVILGSLLNQWAVHLGSGLRFQFREGDNGLRRWIEDTSASEKQAWAIKSDSPYKQVQSEYALITRAMNPTTEQWWVGIGGTTVLGTLGAQQILTDPNAMTILSAQFPRGWEQKNLQVVVEFKMVDGGLGASHVVAAYSW
jgi:hypothetical protein